MYSKFKNVVVSMLGLIIVVFITGCDNKELSEVENHARKEEIKVIEDEVFEEIFTYEPIQSEVYDRIIGKSLPSDNTVDINTLSYLRLTYYGFDDESHLGEIIVNKDIAKEVVDIFKELYDAKYPIAKINLIDEYDAVDEASMNDNNTSAFCYRTIGGSDTLSNHSKGLAIDINPLVNPMVKGQDISPKAGQNYVDREKNTKGMIVKGDACYEAFVKRGWTWGGEWNSLKDYQHFEKR